MSRILISATPIPGHANPLLLVGEHLSKRGHTVVFHCGDLFREKAEAAGLQFVPLLGGANYDYRRLGELFPERNAVEPGLQQLSYDMQHGFGDQIPDQYRGLQGIIDQYGIDAVVTDCLFMGSYPLLLGASKSSPPVIGCSSFPLWMRRRAVSPFTGLDSTAEGLRRNAEHNRQFEDALAPATEYINALLKVCGASRSIGFVIDASCTVFDAFLQFTAEEFEYAVDDKPANLHFVGPMIPAVTSSEEPEWLKKIDGSRPVVLVTQGTIANSDFNQVVKPAIAALAEENIQLIVTTGGGDLDIPLSPNVHVESYIPYPLVLPKVDVFVTNGGYNGVQQALSLGVPVIAAGATEDKPFVAARVAAFGVGIDLKTGSPTAEQIRDAVRTVLSDGKYKQRALEMQKAFARCNALETTAAIVESTIAESAMPVWSEQEMRAAVGKR